MEFETPFWKFFRHVGTKLVSYCRACFHFSYNAFFRVNLFLWSSKNKHLLLDGEQHFSQVPGFCWFQCNLLVFFIALVEKIMTFGALETGKSGLKLHGFYGYFGGGQIQSTHSCGANWCAGWVPNKHLSVFIQSLWATLQQDIQYREEEEQSTSDTGYRKCFTAWWHPLTRARRISNYFLEPTLNIFYRVPASLSTHSCL